MLRLGKAAALCVWAILTSTLAPGLCQAGEALPEVSEVTRRLLERANVIAQSEPVPQYTFDSHSILEKLDGGGKAIETEEKFYHVEWIAGFPFKRLVRIKDRELSPEELKEEQREEERFREKVTSMNPRKMSERKESVVSTDLLNRYRFEVKERIYLEGRPTLVVTFKAKQGPDAGKTIRDKVLNRLEGTLWIDEVDADTARVTITLVDPLTLGWLAILGSLTQCDYMLERRRMPEAVWVNNRQVFHIQFRKLTSTTHYRKTEQSSDFKKVEETIAAVHPGDTQ